MLYQIKGMKLRNINIGDAIARQLDEGGELTPFVPWWNIKECYKKIIGWVQQGLI